MTFVGVSSVSIFGCLLKWFLGCLWSEEGSVGVGLSVDCLCLFGVFSLFWWFGGCCFLFGDGLLMVFFKWFSLCF